MGESRVGQGGNCLTESMTCASQISTMKCARTASSICHIENGLPERFKAFRRFRLWARPIPTTKRTKIAVVRHKPVGNVMTGASWRQKERRTREGEYFEHNSRAPVGPNTTNACFTDLRSVPNTSVERQLTVDADRPYC